MRFRLKDKYWLSRLEEILKQGPKTLSEDDKICFSWDQVLCMAKATGLKSKRKRHIVKRFRLVMKQAVTDLINNWNSY